MGGGKALRDVEHEDYQPTQCVSGETPGVGMETAKEQLGGAGGSPSASTTPKPSRE
jgi:hypothetical protein